MNNEVAWSSGGVRFAMEKYLSISFMNEHENL